MTFLRLLNQYLAATLIGLCTLPIYAAEPAQALGSVKTTAEKESPAKNSETSMLDQFRAATRQADVLKIYYQHIKDQIKSQSEEKLSLEKQLKDIEVTQQEVLPLILRMLASLDKFVQMDLR